jgi:hypothetical protein
MPRFFDGRPRASFGWRSTRAEDDAQGQPSNTRGRREGTRIGLAIGIEVLRQGSDEVTIFAQRLDSSVAFDYRIQFLSKGLVRFFRTPPSHQVWKVMRHMDFQPEDRRNQI